MVIINGKSYAGSNITVTGDKVFVDGNLADIGDTLEVIVEGDIESLKTDGSATVNGNVGNASSGGSMRCN